MGIENVTVREGALAQRAATATTGLARRGLLARRLGARLRDAVPVRPGAAAEDRLEALQRETGVVAHDLNNLLNVILAANEAIAEAAPSDAAELAKMSQDAAETAGALLRRLSTLSEPEHAPPVDGGAATRSVARLARLSTPASVMVEAQAAEEPLPCAVDGAGLESALLNLCVNAAHAMPAGGCLRLSARRADLDGATARAMRLAPGAYAALAVTDTGVGMAPEVLARATEPFFTTRRGRGGSGLGLASVADFVRRAGGRLVLESEVGRGTTATLWLPLA